MSVLEYKEFKPSLVKLRQRGGPYQKAAERTIVMMEDLKGGAEVLANLPVTNHGENRIKKAVKYDLTNACRLVTIQDGGFIFLCFVGNHDETDRWLEKNRGLTIRVGKDCRPVATFESVDVALPQQRIEREMGFTSKPLLSLLDERLQDNLLSDINWKVASNIAKAVVSISDDEILELVSNIENEEKKIAIFDTLIYLRADDIDGAIRRVRAFLGELQHVEDAEIPETILYDSSDFQKINVDSEHYRQLIEHFSRNADYKEWMLFMHPDQQQFVDADYMGPTKLSGVSGSGKTCVVVRRALALASKYPNEKILILTLNRSLAALIEALVDKAALPEVRNRVDVLPFFTLCQSLLSSYEPENERLYDDVTWKSKEHIDEVWREYYRCELNNFSARVLQRLHDSLISRGIDAERYIRDEFDWIRSATAPDTREAYLKMGRSGRTYGLDESFRRELLEGLKHWEDKMRFVGVTDYLGITNALYRHIDQINPIYRSVLIDESQDFGTIDIRIVRKLVLEAENDVFFCGDAAQQVSFKHQNLGEAGIPVPGARSHKLVLNYRNSREILELAHGMLIDSMSEQMLDSKDFEVLDPKYANFSGPAPLLLQAGNLLEELYSAVDYARNEAISNTITKICIAVCGYSEHELAGFAKQVDLPLLDGEARLEQGQIFISDLENTKGFEFQCMIVVNCSAEVIPYTRAPEDEAFRDLSRLYVAMTRARQQLVVSYCGQPSNFIKGQRDKFSEEKWTEYHGAVSIPDCFALPAKLEQLRLDGRPVVDAITLTGEAYLYTDHALGCPSSLVDKLRILIRGKSVIRNGVPVEWPTIERALKDTASYARSRNVFGPEGYKQLREWFVSKQK